MRASDGKTLSCNGATPHIVRLDNLSFSAIQVHNIRCGLVFSFVTVIARKKRKLIIKMDFLFLLFYDLFDRVIAYEVHIDLNPILIDYNLVYVLIDDHAAICQSAVF